MVVTTAHHWIVASTIHVHCSSLKPILTEVNKWARLEMALHFRDHEDPTKYQDMCDWEKERYLLPPNKKNPKWCIEHKLHITKAMFLCAVARPQYNPCAKSCWNGKLGIWPIGDWEPSKQKSKNRPKGTLVWKKKMVTKEVY